MTKNQFNHFIFIGILVLLSGFLFYQCAEAPAPDGPKFTLVNPRTLVKNIRSNYISTVRFDRNGNQLVFNGRLDGDSWDCIYTIPAQGGDYRKMIESTDNLYYPAFSTNNDKIIYTKGYARQIMVYDIATGETRELPIFGNTPLLLPDDETVLYSGVIDANLKLFHIPSRRSKNVTESYISANFAPALLTDNVQLHWIEKLRNGIFKLVRGNLPDNIPEPLFENRKPVWGLTTSPSGQWTMLNYHDGTLMAINSEDTTSASVTFEHNDEQEHTTRHLVCLPDWSITGNKLVYSGVSDDPFSSENPFFRHGYFMADLVIADLQWAQISNGDIVRPLAAQEIDHFPDSENPPETESAIPRNNPPRIISMPPTTAVEGDLFVYRIEAIDIDLFDELKYRLTSGPNDAELMNNSGILYWVAGEAGNYPFSVTVSDGKIADLQTFSVNVLPRPDWHSVKPTRRSQAVKSVEYLAGLVFKDPNNDGFLSSGEQAQLLIDLRTRSGIRDSVKLQLLSSVGPDEIEMQQDLLFERCSPDRWSRKIIPINGLEKLQNRSIIIRGLLEDSTGISFLPASLVIATHNPSLNN